MGLEYMLPNDELENDRLGKNRLMMRIIFRKEM